ncbi:Putative Ctr copper transporter [[Torrubiella] hemipterigena]|uniref:Copper transport protein n=1 Tax=[Torrubiella] hemipterigena TaxID=1531966 RepID=A0A0A1SWD3_9HYPO|nr:Putative Ctr copper transporter [[Torrubiella] hemipterigena]
MDHSAMDHSGHGGMPGMDDMCSMSMLFTWDTKNLCIVFRQWHIRSTLSLIISLLAIVLIGVGYEALRALSRSYETASNQRIQSLPSEYQTSFLFPIVICVFVSFALWDGQLSVLVFLLCRLLSASPVGLQAPKNKEQT